MEPATTAATIIQSQAQNKKTEISVEKNRHKKFHRSKSSNSEIEEKVSETLASNSPEISDKRPSRRLSNSISRDHDKSPPKSLYTYEIFQKSLSETNSLEKLIPESQAKEISFTDCMITSNVAEKLFPIISLNGNFTTLSFTKGELDNSIFNALQNSLSTNKGRIKNFEFNAVQLSYHSFAHLIHVLKKYPNTVLTLNKCSLLESKTEKSELFNDILDKNIDSNHISNANSNANVVKNSLIIKLLDLNIDQDKFDEVVTGILNTNSAELHIHKGQYVTEKNSKFTGHHEVIKNTLKDSTPSLLNDKAKKIIKFYNVNISALALAGMIQKLQGYKEYRLRLESCTIMLNDENGLKSFAEQLAITKNEGKGYPLILELIDIKTDLDNGTGKFIEAILSSNISHLHIQKCNVMSTAEDIKIALSSGKCSLDSLLISEDQFDLLALENITKGIVQQNTHSHGLSRITIEDCGLTSTHSQLIGKLISEGKKLTNIGLSKNALGSDIIAPVPSRRRSSGNIQLTSIKKTNSDLMRSQEFESNKLSKEQSSEVKKVPSQNLQGLPDRKLKAMEVIAAAIEERWTSENCQPLILSLTANHLSANDAKVLTNALQKNTYPKDKEPPVFVDAGGNNLQSKIDDSNQALLNTKGESPRSIIIAQTKPEVISRSNSEDNKYKLPELNSNVFKATPRSVMISPRRESSPILSPRSLSNITTVKITKASDEI